MGSAWEITVRGGGAVAAPLGSLSEWTVAVIFTEPYARIYCMTPGFKTSCNQLTIFIIIRRADSGWSMVWAGSGCGRGPCVGGAMGVI